MKPQSAKCRRCKETFEKSDSGKICPVCKTTCSTCGTSLTDENFYKYSFSKRSTYICNDCVKRRVKETRGNKGFCQESYDLQRQYGITKEERDRLFSSGCEICGVYNKLCVDHDHLTGKVRGCLCSRCNTAIGMFDDNTEKLKKAEGYLNRFKEIEGQASPAVGTRPTD